MKPLFVTNWNQLQPDLKGFVFRRIKDKAAAEDLIQDVYLRAEGRFDQLNDPSKFAAWVYQIAKNKITDYYRDRARRVDPSELDWTNDPAPLTVCASDCLKNTMNQLPDKYRQALELAEIQNVPQTELAVRLGISYSGVKSRVQRAREMLKVRMDEQYRIETDGFGNVLVCKSRVPCECREKESC